MEVDLIAESAAESTAPVLSPLPPAARLGDEYADDIAVSEQTPTPPAPDPVTRTEPAPAPKQVAEPKTPPPKKRTPPARQEQPKIGREHVWTPVTQQNLIFRILLEINTTPQNRS